MSKQLSAEQVKDIEERARAYSLDSVDTCHFVDYRKGATDQALLHMEEVERLEQEVSSWKIMCKEAEIRAEKNNERRYGEIGLMEYKGNSVSFIYDKMLARGVGIDKLLAERDQLKSLLGEAMKALEKAQTYICDRSNNCMPCPEGILGKSHGCECMDASESLHRIRASLQIGKRENT